MNVWLITIGEPIPLEGKKNDRLLRTGYFAQLMAQNGIGVTWWSSTFSHVRKQHFFNNDKFIQSGKNLKIRLLHGCGYRRNLSLDRILDHKQLALKFTKVAKYLEPPAIILSSLPPVELSLAAVKYGKEHNVPVILDMRDMWPDIFIEYIPGFFRPIAKLLMMPMYWEVRKACAGATAITGITDEFVKWGVRRGRRLKSEKDVAFPLGYSTSVPAKREISAAKKFWKTKDVTADNKRFVACFIGTIGRQFDLSAVIRTAQKLEAFQKQFQFVICGAGDMLNKYKELARNSHNFIFPGWVNAIQIRVLMRLSCVGLNPIPDRYDFLATINNKAIEYMSAGLPIISSPEKGVLYDLLKKYGCGMSYTPGDEKGLFTILSRLHETPELLQKMSQNAKQLFSNMFTAEDVYSNMFEYLYNIAKTNNDRIRGGSNYISSIWRPESVI
jgi:glycosyltransferase involved in cell wall biosynthesis